MQKILAALPAFPTSEARKSLDKKLTEEISALTTGTSITQVLADLSPLAPGDTIQNAVDQLHSLQSDLAAQREETTTQTTQLKRDDERLRTKPGRTSSFLSRGREASLTFRPAKTPRRQEEVRLLLAGGKIYKNILFGTAQASGGSEMLS
jgi:hypothetical protein